MRDISAINVFIGSKTLYSKIFKGKETKFLFIYKKNLLELNLKNTTESSLILLTFLNKKKKLQSSISSEFF